MYKGQAKEQEKKRKMYIKVCRRQLKNDKAKIELLQNNKNKIIYNNNKFIHF